MKDDKRGSFLKILLFIGITLLIFGINLKMFSNANRIRVAIDNKYIQTYRNKQGKWILNKGYYIKRDLTELALEYQVSPEEIEEINNHNLRKRYIFVPYGEEYLEKLLKQGYGRRLFDIDPRKYLWPVEKPDFTSRFGKRFNEVHTGLDMAVPIGTPVVAAQDGIVKKTGWMGGYGKAIIIQHFDGRETLYGHLSEILIEENEEVLMGQIIAFSGNTGRSTGPHLHFEVRFENITLNPEDFLPESFFRSDVIIRESDKGIAIQETLPDIERASSNIILKL
ncbi:MAG: peptidase M23 [Leptospiraceae bacterium]|nr:MAG: peptidase M23 [Leptospiraceae bacterium]